MISADLPPPAAPARAALARPAIVQPAPYQASFGTIVARVPAGTRFVVLLVDGKERIGVVAGGERVTISTDLPLRDVTLRVVAVGASGWRLRSAPVGPVSGLPRAAAPRKTGSREDASLARRVRALVRDYGGQASAYVQDLRSGIGAAWNARARFPGASALKLAIAVETLRTLGGPPAKGSSVDSLMRRMLIDSDNAAANALETLVGGSTGGGSARINAMLRSIGLYDTDMYGGYIVESARAIPITANDPPAIERTKHSTAWDLSRLLRFVYLACGGQGPLVGKVDGFSPAEARYLLHLLLHVRDRGKLDRFLPGATRTAHKAGWIAQARSDNGIVFWSGGAFVATVMTYSAGGVGTAADVLAGRVARAGLDRFRALG